MSMYNIRTATTGDLDHIVDLSENLKLLNSEIVQGETTGLRANSRRCLNIPTIANSSTS